MFGWRTFKKMISDSRVQSEIASIAIGAGEITNTNVNASAAIAGSKLQALSLGVNAGVLPSTGLVNAHVAAGAAIAFSKLATLASGNILVGSAGGVVTSVAMSGDATIVASGAITIGSGKVTAGMLASGVGGTPSDGSVTDVKVAAGIDPTKLTLVSGKILVGDGSNAAAPQTVSGDITISASGVGAIAAGVIIDADINASAAIASTKIVGTLDAKTLTAAGAITQTGTVTFGTGTGAVSLNGTVTIATGKNLALTKGTVLVGIFEAAKATANAVALTTDLDIWTDGQLDVVGCYGASLSNLGGAYSAKVGRFRHVANGITLGQETYGLVGQMVVKNVTLSHLHSGLMGTFEVDTAATVSIGDGVGVAGVTSRIGGATITVGATGVLAGTLSTQNATIVSVTSGGVFAAFACRKVGSGITWAEALHIEDALVAFRFKAASDTYAHGVKVSAATPAGDCSHAIKVMIGTTAGYIPVYAAETF